MGNLLAKKTSGSFLFFFLCMGPLHIFDKNVTSLEEKTDMGPSIEHPHNLLYESIIIN